MGMRRLFIIRKDLHLSAGKLGAMVAKQENFWTKFSIEHQQLKAPGFRFQLTYTCAEGYWIWLIRKNTAEHIFWYNH